MPTTTRHYSQAATDSDIDSLGHTPLAVDRNQLLSDHKMQGMPLTADESPLIISWNIMTRGRRNAGNKTNNAFGIEEDEAEYTRRLDRIVNFINSSPDSLAQTAAIALQEVPKDRVLLDEFIAKLRSLLPDGWVIDNQYFTETKDGINSNFGQLTLINGNLVSAHQKADLPNLGIQEGRAHAVDLTLHTPASQPAKKIRVVNAHFNVKNGSRPLSPKDAVPIIEEIFNTTREQVVIAGDFNQDVNELGKKDLLGEKCYFADGPTSYSYESDSVRKPKSVDGFMFRYAPEQFDFQEASKSDPILKSEASVAFTKTLSVGTLCTHFLNKKFEVTRHASNSQVLIKKPGSAANTEELQIKKESEEKLSFVLKSNSPEMIAALQDAINLTTDKKAPLKINVTGGSEDQRKTLANTLWLNAIKSGYEVENYQPPEEFLNSHKAEIPDAMKNKLFPAEPEPPVSTRRP